MSALPILAWGLPDDARSGLSAALGAPVVAAGPEAGAAGRILVFGDADRGGFPALLARADVLVEWTDAAATAAAIRAIGAGLALSLTTRATYRILTGRMVGEALVARGLLASAGADAVASALQEALANAVIHGNLGIQAAPNDDPADFFERHTAVAQRIAGPDGLARRVTVAVSWTDTVLTVAVRDQGTGFTPPVAATAPGGRETSGRGLTIMRRHALDVRAEDGGRVAVLTFARHAPPSASSP
jgi:anti-sigma regulatory factor (Ser/Thr protein kinase)